VLGVPTRIAQQRRRPLPILVLASIAVNAALGVYALVVPHFGGFEARILATSASVTGAGVLVLACLPARQRRLPLLPPAGITTSILGFSLIVAGVWGRAESGSPLWKTAWAVLVVAVWCVLMSVLSLARLAPRHRWVFALALFLGGLLAAMIVAAIWIEPSSSAYGRATGIVAILFAAVALAVPIVHRVGRGERQALVPLQACVRFCPSCGRRRTFAIAEGAACRSCGARFQVRFLAGDGASSVSITPTLG
jgi:uncharacterized protein (DUF983 family)